MPLYRQIIELPFFQGLDTKTDSKQLPLGKLLVLQNAVFTAPGKLQKRNGYAALTTNILGGGTLSSGSALFTRSNELCMTTTAGAMYSYDASNTAWVSRGTMPSITTTAAPLANPSQYATYAIDMAVTGTLQCCVYELYDQNATSSNAKGLGYTIVDSTTGQIVVPPATLDSATTTVCPRVVVLGTNFLCYYVDTSGPNIWGRTLSTTTPNAGWSARTQLSSGTTTSAQLGTTGAYQIDACVSGTNGYISFNNRSNGTTIFQTTSASPLAVHATTNIAATNSRASCVFPDVSGDIVLGYLTLTAVTGAVFSSTLGVTRKAATVLDNTLANYSTITGTSTATNTVQFYFTNSPGANTSQIRSNTMTTASYNVGAAATLIRSLGIAAKAFTYSGAAYCPAWYSPNTAQFSFSRVNSPQNTIFLLDSSGNVLSRALSGTTGGYTTVSGGATFFYAPSSASVTSSTVTFPASNSNRITASGQYYTTPASGFSYLNYQYGALALSMNFADTTTNYLRGMLAKSVHTNGGVLQVYDGGAAVEHGFLLYPAGVTVAQTTAAGALTLLGTYGIAVTYEWMDAQGQVHRSAPSVPVSTTLTTTNNTLTATIPTLRVTAKTGVLIQVWRTVANGTTYYLDSNFNGSGSLGNDKTVDTVSWISTQADTAITGNEQLYTTGGILQNGPCAPAGAMTVHRNRLFVVDSTNPTQVWYSKLVISPGPVEFSGFQVLNIDPKGGAITALASLDDKLIIFKTDRVFMVLGQGPDSTGGQIDYTDALLVSSDTGCSFPRSVVVVPDGIMFQSPKGIYQLSRALQTSYIGAPVTSSFTASAVPGPVLSALQRSFTNQVWFSTAQSGTIAGQIVVYDTLVGQWSTFASSIFNATADSVMTTALATGTEHYLLTTAGVVYQESLTPTDAGVSISMTVGTGWIKLHGLVGFQRARRAMVLGDWLSSHTLNVAVYYDYASAAAQTASFASSADPAPYEYMTHLTKQKCEAIRFQISDSATSGLSMSLSGLALEIGVKRGFFRLPAAQTGG